MPMPATLDAMQVADAFFSAIQAADVDAVRDLYEPTATIWHNTDGLEQHRDDNMRTLSWMVRNLPDLTYTDVRRSPTADGFVQEHVLVATNRAGRRIEVPACIVATVLDGRITRLNEYLDSRSVAAIMET